MNIQQRNLNPASLLVGALFFIVVLFISGLPGAVAALVIYAIISVHYNHHRPSVINTDTLTTTTSHGMILGVVYVLLAIFLPGAGSIFGAVVIGGGSIAYSLYLRRKYMPNSLAVNS